MCCMNQRLTGLQSNLWHSLCYTTIKLSHEIEAQNSKEDAAKNQAKAKSTGLVLNRLSIMTQLRRGFEGQVHLRPRTHLICRAVLPQKPAQSTCMGPSFDLSKAPLPQYIARDQQFTYYKHGDSNVKSCRWGRAADLLRQETHGVASLYLGFTIPPPRPRPRGEARSFIV